MNLPKKIKTERQLVEYICDRIMIWCLDEASYPAARLRKELRKLRAEIMTFRPKP